MTDTHTTAATQLVEVDASMTPKVLQTQLKAIKRWGRSTPTDLSKIAQRTLVANGDNDRMVPSVLSDDLHHRIAGSELIIYPDSGHASIFQFQDRFVSSAAPHPGPPHPRRKT